MFFIFAKFCTNQTARLFENMGVLYVPCLYVQYYCFNHGYMQMPKVHSVEKIELLKYIKEFLSREIPRILDLDRVELREKITSQGGAYHKISCNDNILCGKIPKEYIYEEFNY